MGYHEEDDGVIKQAATLPGGHRDIIPLQFAIGLPVRGTLHNSRAVLLRPCDGRDGRHGNRCGAGDSRASLLHQRLGLRVSVIEIGLPVSYQASDRFLSTGLPLRLANVQLQVEAQVFQGLT